jgi:hypothetical protein
MGGASAPLKQSEGEAERAAERAAESAAIMAELAPYLAAPRGLVPAEGATQTSLPRGRPITFAHWLA